MSARCTGQDREYWGEACREPAEYMVLGRGVGPRAEDDAPVCAHHAREWLRWSDRKVEGPDGEVRLVGDDDDDLEVAS